MLSRLLVSTSPPEYCQPLIGDRLINCAFLVVPVPKMKKLIYIKVVVYYGGAFAMLAWVVRLAGGNPPAIHEASTVHGRAKSWLICKFLFLGLASCGTFISNAADLQRYARKPSDVILAQVISFPLSGLLVAVIGNIIAGCSRSIFGEVRLIFPNKLPYRPYTNEVS